MSTTPYGDAVAAIEQLWSDTWTGSERVIWHHNSSDSVPSVADTTNWLHLAVEFEDEQAVAFGAGPFNIEREIRGCVVVRVFSARGLGETDTLRLLDEALVVFRSQRVGALSMIGHMPLATPGASEDGGWWIRSAIAAFVFRFRG